MNRPQQELTLTNVLSDPMVQLAMAADRVNPRELAAMLAGVAKTLRHSTRRRSCATECTVRLAACAALHRMTRLPAPCAGIRVLLLELFGRAPARRRPSQRAAQRSRQSPWRRPTRAPSAYSTCFQNGARVLRKSIRNSAAANASCRCDAAVTTRTICSPGVSRP